MRKTKPSSEKKALLAREALEDKKGLDVAVIDVRSRTILTDFLVIASGSSRIHIRSLMDGVIEKFADSGMKSKRVEGDCDSAWVLIDYGDVVVHIMSPEQREFYRLEAYWSGAEKGSPPPLSPDEVG